jgi:outer membrane protein assembly factor BamB
VREVAVKKTCAVLVFALLGAAPPQEDARETLRRLGVKKGICVVAGAPVDAIGLARAGELVVYVQLEDGGKIEELRRAAETEGLLGKRLYAEKGSLARIHLADNTADAVLAAAGARRDEILRVLRPGGKAFLGAEALAKPFAEGMDEWSHPYHGPDNNPQSKDTLARGPFLTQFMSEPWYSAMPQFSVLSGGRVFKIFGERTSTQAHWESLNSLVALNAWNGTLLWRRKLPETFMFHRNTFVATPEALYLADDKSCKVFDPDTGEVRDEIIAPAELSDGPVWKWMALEGGVLYALVGEAEPGVEVVKGNRFRGAGWPWWKVNDYRFGFGRTLLAIDPKSKKILWHHRDDLPLDARAMCMASGKIFVYSDQKFLAALDAKTGKSLWKNSDEKLLAAIGKHDPAQVPQQGFASTSFAKCSDKAIYFAGPTRTRVVAASTEDGRLLWDRQGGNYQLVIRPEALYALGGGPTRSFKLDLMTGEVLAQFGARVACTRATANADAIFVRGGRGGSTTVYDVQSAEVQTDLISPMRPACQDGVVVANGRLYWGPWICRCDTTQIGVISLGPAGDFDRAAGAAEDRLEKGTGASTVAAIEVTDKDWPAYRHDNARSGRSPLPVPAGVVEKWTFAPSGANVATAPIASGGWVFLAGSDGAIRALDAADGKLRWTAHTGGWVKFAPTLAEGRLYAGSGDGWVYCLEAASGRLLWRFRAAPAERKIPVYGSLFSTWPVGSGVLVHDGVAYAAAGMANYDGSHVYALDAATGKIRWQNNQSGHLPAARPESGAGVQGNLLLHDGALYLPGGNLVPVAKYEIADGKFSRYGMPDRANVLGKDLYVIDGQVRSTGYPLYWRQQDSHHITFARFPAADGHLAVNEGTIGLADPKPGAQGKPQWKWSRQEFTEVAGVAFAQNAVVAAGVNWTGEGPDAKASGGIAALDPKDGRVLWKHALPGVPVMFGAAIDREGRILVSLQDGRVVCLAAR